MQNTITRSYLSNTFFLKHILSNLKDEDLALRTGQSNNIDWILGHLILLRAKILEVLGEKVEISELEKIYERGSEKTDKAYLKLSDALEIFEERGNTIVKIIGGYSNDEITREIDFTLPDGSKTLDVYLKFLAWHETFHIGQIDLIVAANGTGGIK